MFTPITLTSNSFSTAALISGFDASLATLKDDLVVLGSHGRLFGDAGRDDHVVVAKVGIFI